MKVPTESTPKSTMKQRLLLIGLGVLVLYFITASSGQNTPEKTTLSNPLTSFFVDSPPPPTSESKNNHPAEQVEGNLPETDGNARGPTPRADVANPKDKAASKGTAKESHISAPKSDNTKVVVVDNNKEWSYDWLERRYKQRIASLAYPKGNAAADRNILFVDGREQCEAARGFLLSVRNSGFLGHIVYMVYYAEDEKDCQKLAQDFAPMEIFYRPTPKWEMTLVQYFGVVNYFNENPEAITKYAKAGVVKPDDVVWCKNPFLDIPQLGAEPVQDAIYGALTNRSFFAVHGHQTDVHPDNYEFFDREKPWQQDYVNLEMPGNKRIIDHFIGGSPYSLYSYMNTMLTFALNREFDYTKATFNIVNEFDEVKNYVTAHFLPLEPKAKYVAANCYYYLPPNPEEGLRCNQYSLVVGTTRCMRKVTYIEPNYTPFCKQPYRNAINEVPSDMNMSGYAFDRVLKGAHAIRDKVGAVNNIFTEQPGLDATVSEQCPNGVLGVLSMMVSYKIDMVGNFIGSFLSHADPHCTRMIIMIGPNDGTEKLQELYPDRVEFVMLDDQSPFKAETLKDCKAPADRRFEVIQRWLDKNYMRFRYIMATDSRDYLFLADPLAQLVKILKADNYIGKDFVGSVAESFTAGGTTHPHHLASYLMTEWVKSCGKLCYRKMAKSTFTNGEPFALLNSGHMIGTGLGLLHYFRFHVRMLIESAHQCDGSDQGLMTYYMYGMLQEAQYPHKVLVFSTSRSGFGNMPPPHRMSKRERNGDWEYTITDCNNNIYAGIHQFDRYQKDFHRLAGNPAISQPWLELRRNGTFDEFFRPKQ